MKSILVLVFNDLRHDARVRRQVEFLKRHGRLTIVCFDAPAEWTHEVIRIPRIKPGLWIRAVAGILLLLRRYSLAYKALYSNASLSRSLKKKAFDLVVANDIECLPLAEEVRGQAKVLFDAHEYAPRHFEDKRIWRIFFQPFNTHMCKAFLPRTDAMMTVGKGLAEEYKRNFGVNPVVVTNANYYRELSPSPVRPGKIRLIHHGAANPSRQLELTIAMMDHLDERFELTLMLVVPAMANPRTSQYIESLKSLIVRNPRIHLVPPVSSENVVTSIHDFDIGVFLLPPVNFNYANTLPNKFFDFVQARLGIAIGPTPEMADLVVHYGLGVVSDEFTAASLAAKLNALSMQDVALIKQNSQKAAEDLSAERNIPILEKLVGPLLS